MRHHRLRRKTAAASWTCSGTEEGQRLSRLLAGAEGQLGEKFTRPFGVHPLLSIKPVVKSARPRGHPKFLQWLLQVHDNLTAVGESERDHATHPLIVDVGICGIVDAVAGTLQGAQSSFSVIQVFVVGHYNAKMINTHRILGALCGSQRLLVAAALMGAGLLVTGCGQKGPLYLAVDRGAQAQPAKPAANADVKDPLSK